MTLKLDENATTQKINIITLYATLVVLQDRLSVQSIGPQLRDP